MLGSLRPLVVAGVLFAAVVSLVGGTSSQAGEDPRFVEGYIDGLRSRGYFDLALDAIDEARKDPATPDSLRQNLDYREAKVLVEAATRDTDPEVSLARLDKAKTKLEAFLRANPDGPDTSEALVSLANLQYERGRTEVYFAGEMKTPQDRENRLVAGRRFYGSAREAFTRAVDRLSTKLATYPRFIPAEDNKRREEREQVRGMMINAELQREIASYDEAQTLPADSPQRKEMLEAAQVAFNKLFDQYRTQMAGLTARMWQGKCFEEQGELGKAMGIYKELLDHADPAVRRLQRQVDYFRIIVMAKRKDYALAADECNRWLAMFPKDRRSYEALGVQLELAKNILAQLPNAGDNEKPKAIRVATDALTEVVHVTSPFKPEALAILQKYRPSAALSASDAAKMSFDDALSEANTAISNEDYPRAIALLRAAGRKVDPTRELARANRARISLGYALFKSNRFAEAAVVDGHIARHDPTGEWSAKAAEVAILAMLTDQNQASKGERTRERDQLADFARYVIATWPDNDQGDTARLVLGEVAAEREQFADAVKAFDSVRSGSTRKADAQAAAGSAHWRSSLDLREASKTTEADTELTAAIGQYQASLKTRRDGNVAETEPNFVGTACELALIEVASDKANDAITLMEPIVGKLGTPTKNSPPTTTRAITALLRAHVAAGKVDQALVDMKTLESGGNSGTNSAQLYFELGRLLEKETETLKQRGDKARLARTEAAYQKFLKALVANKTGQTFQSLQWAAGNLLKLGAADEAVRVYADLIDYYAKDEEFQKNPNANQMLLTARIKQVAALRQVGKLVEAETKLNEISTLR